MLRFLVPLVVCALSLGCGARTLLRVEGRDGGPRMDAGDSGPTDAGMLSVECGRSTQFTTPRRPITLEATTMGPDAIVEQGWALVTSPAGSSPTLLSSPDPRIATLTPDVQGTFVMRFSARDVGGRSASCQVDVMAIVGPPVAICPEEDLYTGVDVPLRIEGDGFDDEMIVSFHWEIVGSPVGAAPILSNTEEPIAVFQSSTRGTYVLRLTVFDNDMSSGSCEVEVLVSGPPEVNCGATMISAPTRQPVSLSATATDDVGIVSRRWDVIARPSGSTAVPMPPDADRTSFVPDRRGTYVLRFTAIDVEGSSSSCEVTLIGLPTPPTVTCPATVDTVPRTPVTITASAEDDGSIVRWAWRLDSRPMLSSALPPTPSDAPTTSFFPDLAGIYVLSVTATDDDGMTGTCTTRVAAGNVDGLRIEMSWNTDGTDMDTHLLNPTGTRWTSSDDCYYGNCTGGPVLEWGAAGTADNPRLDIDDTDGRGPENINITAPQPGTYRVAIHAYRGNAANAVIVNVYCGGSTTTPRQTFGPVNLRGTGSPSANDFWRVADVTISTGGCTITDLRRADGSPWIEVESSTIGMR